MPPLLEVWKPVVGFPEYSVSSQGRIRSEFRVMVRKNGASLTIPQKILAATVGKNGYRMVDLSTNDRYVHHLVAEAFHGPRPEGNECRHLDGNRLNNNYWNLAWGTSLENTQDRVRHGVGTIPVGEKHPKAFLTGRDVKEIRHSYEAGARICDIAKAHGLRDAHVGNIVKRIIWRSVP